MSRNFAGIMDDTGFTLARRADAEKPPAAASRAWDRTAPSGRPAPRFAWTAGIGAAVALHVAVLGGVSLARGHIDLPPAPPPVMYLDLTPRAPMTRPKTARTSGAETPPQAAPDAPSRPLPFTPRQLVPAAPPPSPDLARPPSPPAPAAPRAEAPRPAAEAAAAPAAAPASTPSPDFQRKVLAALERVRRYPPAARARREEGTVVVAFSMDRSGRVLSASIQRGSGSAALDRAALETVRRANLPSVPDNFSDPLRLVLPVEFSLN